ncbi:MAG: LamG domain-containing protein [Alphaproteobacteria bacterium]|nr:LamG domain-containing protein [Alphaproteobacteria bacterium]
MKKLNRAFSLVELSIAILIIGIVIAGIAASSSLFTKMKLSSARQLTSTSPVPSIPNLTLWLESTSEGSFTSTSLSNNDAIAQWNDINPRNTYKNNATGASGKQPLYSTNIINGLPALKFDGTDDVMSLASTDVIGGERVGTIFTVAVVSTAAGASNVVHTVFRSNSSAAVKLTVLANTSTAKCGRFFYDTMWRGSDTPTSAPAIGVATPVICSARYNGSQVQGWTNGSVDTAASMTGIVAIPTSTVIGASAASSGDTFLNGYIAEIIVYNRSLTTDERTDVEKYLSKKWNIKIS